MVKVEDKKSSHSDTIVVKNDKDEFNIYDFSESVIKELSAESLPSIPKNYSIFFEKMLELESDAFRKKMGEIMNMEDDNEKLEDDRKIYIEREIKQSFGQIKSMLQAVSLVYKNLGIMKTIIKKRIDSLDSNVNLLTVQNVFSAFNEDLDKLNSLMTKHVEVIKSSYEDISRIFKVIEEQSIYDVKYDLFNKKHLLKTLENELVYVQKYGYHSTFMMIRAKESILENLSVKDKQTIQKNISKFLLKTSRRSDMLAHYGDGVFAMLMKHTDIEGAKKACERIADMFYSATFVIGDSELDMDMEICVSDLAQTKVIETMLTSMLDSLPNSSKDGNRYVIAKEDAK
ncbi:MAG: GGDEF domain-containing protein [Campylobacter sp.]